MARPRKMTTAQMIEVVNSYYFTRAEGSAKLLKCSQIAEYAAELGYTADGYDFRRNTEVREYIDLLKEGAPVPDGNVPVVYKGLDVAGFIRNNREVVQLAKALTEMDAHWKKVSEYAAIMSRQNQTLMGAKSSYESALKDAVTAHEKLNADNAGISAQNNKLSAENRYLRKMLRIYLYPAVANEILTRENVLKDADTQVTGAAVRDMTEFSAPQSLQESVTSDIVLQSAEEQLLAKMWEACDE